MVLTNSLATSSSEAIRTRSRARSARTIRDSASSSNGVRYIPILCQYQSMPAALEDVLPTCQVVFSGSPFLLGNIAYRNAVWRDLPMYRSTGGFHGQTISASQTRAQCVQYIQVIKPAKKVAVSTSIAAWTILRPTEDSQFAGVVVLSAKSAFNRSAHGSSRYRHSLEIVGRT